MNYYTEELIQCKNCNNHFTGKFCNSCGQNSNTERINSHYILHEIQHLVSHIDKGFLYTIKELSINSGKAIREYIEGKRINFFKPTSFIILLSAIHIFLEHFSNKEPLVIDFLLGLTSTLKDSQTEHQNLGLQTLNWLINNYSYTSLLLIPIFSVASYFAFRKSKYNFFEHLVLNTYTYGHILFIFILLFPISYFTQSDFKDYLQILILLGFTIWTFFTFFNDVKKINRILNTIITFGIFLVLIGIGIMILSIVSFI